MKQQEINNVFPSSAAIGAAFCGRNNETERLVKNIEKAAHTVIIAPRRYGKTSLSHHAINIWENKSTKNIAATISMLPISSITCVEEVILRGISKALSKILPTLNMPEIKQLAASLSSIGLSLILDTNDIKLVYSDNKNLSNPSMALTNIERALNILDSFAQKGGWSILFEIDEFQEITRLPNALAIEATIRDVIQHTSKISCIFLGANKQTLEHMFTSKERPFYNMCHIISLDRIQPVHYHTHLGKMSALKWGSPMSSELIDIILKLSECHPYYVNKLCSDLWRLEDKPSASNVDAAWANVVSEEGGDITTLLTSLSLAQKALIKQLATQPERALSSQQFLSRVNLASSTMRTAMKRLQKDDLVYQDDNGAWRVMNPCLTAYLK